MATYILDQAIVRLLDVEAHSDALEILVGQLLDDLVQLVERRRGLPHRGPARESHPNVVLHIAQCRAILAALPHVGEALGDLTHRPLQPRIVGTNNHQRGFLTKSVRHDPDETLAGLEFRNG